MHAMAQRYPGIFAVATFDTRDQATVVAHGCDDEFELALDVMLDGSSGCGSADAARSGRVLRTGGYCTSWFSVQY